LQRDELYEAWSTLARMDLYIRFRADEFVKDFGDWKGFVVQAEALEIVARGFRELSKEKFKGDFQ
jgi:hypothetical protein